MEVRSIRLHQVPWYAVSVAEALISNPAEWQRPGLEFLLQLMDTSPVPVKFKTSGTTGIPKEITFSKEQIFTSASNTCRYFGIQKNDNLLLCLPSEFVAGRLMFARAMVSGTNLEWVQPSLNPLLEADNIRFAAFTPAQVATILANPVSRNRFQSIRTVIVGGGEISPQLEKELMHFENEIYATYGMTETLTHVAVRRVGENEYKWVHGEGGFSTDENDCLVVHLPFISTDPVVTKDVVLLQDPHTFIWKGRTDNVINTGGKKIFSEALEQLIREAGSVEGEFYITSAKDPVFGEIPVLVIQNGTTVPSLENVNLVLKKHESIKRIEIIDKFEYTPTGKIKRLKF